MEQVAAYSTVAMTLGLVVARPRVSGFRPRPAAIAGAGVLILVALGVVALPAAVRATVGLWRSFAALACIMIMTDVAHRVGLLDVLAARIEARARTAAGLFATVFALGAAAATALNNDAAILLLTPLVITLVRRRFPGRADLEVVFATAVFMSAGVAPLVISNPMNMIVAEYSGIGFNHYAAHMIPVAAATWLVGFAVLRWLFRRQLSAPMSAPPGSESVRLSGAHVAMLSLVVAVLVAYSAVAYAGGPVWVVALAGAAVALALSSTAGGPAVAEVVRRGVAWETLAFLAAILILAMGLHNVGFVDHLSAHYASGSPATVGITSAVGSALFNNHPMAYMNMMALDGASHGQVGVFAALVGGDLGPRLVPIGSLAGLLWLELLRRRGVHISLGQFVRVGFLVTVPALAAALGVLALY